MTSAFSQNKNFELQATGDHNGTWGVALNAVLSLMDQLGGATAAINAASGSANITTSQLDNFRWNITGVLAGDIVLTIQQNAAAQNVSGYFCVDNAATGAHKVTVSNAGGGGRSYILPQGQRSLIYTDGTNVDPVLTPAVMWCGTTAGTNTAYTATAPGSASALTPGVIVAMIFNSTCGNQPTLNLTMAGSAVGALALYKPTSSGPTRLTTSDVINLQLCVLAYDPALNGAAGGYHVVAGIAPPVVSSVFLDNAFIVENSGDTTKQIKFDASTLATGHVTTLQVPDLNGTGIVVTTAATQTLTNKSLTSPTITGSPTAVGATWANLGTATTAQINGGGVDNTPIGATTRSTGKFTTLDANTSITVGSQTFTSVLIQGKETIWVPASAMYARTTQGATANQIELGTNKVNLKTFDFTRVSNAAGSVTFVQFAVQMPKSWNAGTVTFKPAGLFNASTTASAAFMSLAGKAYAASATLDAAQGTAVGVTLTGSGTINQMIYGAESGAITIGSAAAGPIWVNFELKRDVTSGSDTTANAVTFSLLGMHLYYTVNAGDDT